MRYWLFMFRPETFEDVKRHRVLGVRPQAAKRFAELRRGDRFVVYVSRQRVLGGQGEITGDPYIDDTPIFSGKGGYSHRVSVSVEPAAHETPGVDALWAAESLRSSKTYPWNVLLTRGSFTELEPSEYEWFVKQMESAGDET